MSDEGPGIAPDDQQRIFEKFYRGGNEETRKAKGTGLGLYIVQRLAQRLGGAVQALQAPVAHAQQFGAGQQPLGSGIAVMDAAIRAHHHEALRQGVQRRQAHGGRLHRRIERHEGAAQLRLTPNAGQTEVPATGLHYAGELHTNDGGLYYCVTGGSPGTWRALARPTSAGALVPVAPARVYDSRHDLTYMGPPNHPIGTGQTRTVSVAHKVDATGSIVTLDYVPAGVTAIAYNLTVVNTVGTNGWLAVNPGGNVTVSASALALGPLVKFGLRRLHYTPR